MGYWTEPDGREWGDQHNEAFHPRPLFGSVRAAEGALGSTMARRYATEMARLAGTFEWAATADLGFLRQAVRTAGLSPLRVIGSGGSLTGAHALAGLHQRHTGKVAAVATPLEVVEAVDEPLDATAAVWLLSAGGGNADILAAARALILREPRQIGVLCGREASPLARLCRRHPFIDLLLYPPPTGKDGFLATNSLLGFAALLTRAYATEFGSDADWQDVVDNLTPLLPDTASRLEAWEAATVPLWTRSTTLVLHGSSTRIGAIDLESKFTEAALGHLQLADYRNFAHGRHHWLAKRPETSAVLAFVTYADRALAERTLDLIPADVPQARIAFDGGPNAVALASLLAALRITGWAGRARNIDPGRPGVPEFGRKIYHLQLPRPRRATVLAGLTPREAAAITRKAGVPPGCLAVKGELGRWRDALAAFLARLRAARFAGVVLDYDGTVVDTRHRSVPAAPGMMSEIARLAGAGARIGIATGRGQSVRRDLQKRLPRALWSLVLVGYYNGSDVALLDDDGAPDGSENVCAALQPLAEALHSQTELSECARQTDRPFQITLEAARAMPVSRLWHLVGQVILTTGVRDVAVTCSGHSVDVVPAGVSKLDVVRQLRATTGQGPVLAIGDRGRWPGNDHELLSEPFALGVDEISCDPATCWHLGGPGQRGPTVTLEYLTELEARDDRLAFATGALR